MGFFSPGLTELIKSSNLIAVLGPWLKVDHLPSTGSLRSSVGFTSSVAASQPMARHYIGDDVASRASIQVLPHELLEKIFDIGARMPVPVDDKYPRRPLFSKMPQSPLYASTVSHVCIRWREIILQMPVVWSFIHLTRSLDTHRRLRSCLGRSLEWLPAYLSRSRHFPLHITLDTTRLPTNVTLSLINPYSARWRTFTLLVSHVGSLPPILPSLVRTHVPSLRCLSISSDIYREGIVCYDPLVPFFVAGTPQLSAIRLTGVYVAWNALPLANLQNLELHLTSRWPNFIQLQFMFDASPMLQRLVIHDDIASVLRHVDQPSDYPTVELERLKHLEVEVFRIREERADVAGLLRIFSLPILQVLTIKGVTFDEWISITNHYDLPAAAYPAPHAHHTGGTTRNRNSSWTLKRSFPYLSSLTVTNS